MQKKPFLAGLNFGAILGAFGEVLDVDLTKFHAGNPQTVVVGGFSLASGEIFGLNLTKCPKTALKMKSLSTLDFIPINTFSRSHRIEV